MQFFSLDGVGWEGGDEWVRAQFRLYLLCLLRTSLNSNEDHISGSETTSSQNPELNKFNISFVQQWKKTMNYKLWKEHVSNEALDIENFINLPALHPCSGQLSIGDVKLHISNSITNTEGGKKVTQAVANTGRAVAGGISTAKGVFSSWMSSLKTNQGPTGQEIVSGGNQQKVQFMKIVCSKNGYNLKKMLILSFEEIVLFYQHIGKNCTKYFKV